MTPALENPKKRIFCIIYNGNLPAIRVEADTICKERLSIAPTSWKITLKRAGEVVGEVETDTPDWWIEEE